MKGQIFARWYIECGKCKRVADLETSEKSIANEKVRKSCKKTRAYGWICPVCRGLSFPDGKAFHAYGSDGKRIV